MSLRSWTTILVLVFYSLTLGGQDTWYGTISGMHFMYNPAYTGSSGFPAMNISCYSFLPGNNFALRSGYASFDTYSPGLHGGAGIWLSDDMLGEIMNDIEAGAPVRDAVINGFTGRLADVCLKAIGEQRSTPEENYRLSNSWCYQPLRAKSD